MKKIIFFITLLITDIASAQAPKDYSCNPHVKFQVDTLYGQYTISYTFKDQKDILRTFKFIYNEKKTLADMARYGVPVSFFDDISGSTPVSKSRMKEISKGFFVQNGNILKPDRSAIVSYYRPYCKSIAGGIISILMSEGSDNRENRILMAMRFVQDIPYGVPEINDSTWEVYGIYTPPEVLIRMFGDCDSKAILFTCILSYLIDAKDILFLFQGHDHALIAIKGIPGPKQKYIEVSKAKYIIADVTGPLRLDLGDDGNKFDATVGYKIEPVKVKGYWLHSI
jgi:hypothetical protein